MNFKKLIVFNISFLLSTLYTLAADGTIKGKITDTNTKEALIGVNVTTDNNLSTISDVNGEYELKAPEGTYTLTFSYVGYTTNSQKVKVKADETTSLDLKLEDEAKNVLGNDLVITGSLYQKHASEEVISVDVIKPKQLATSNILRIDEVARRVSGLNIADGQANIRAGSGWSYGVGSRVMMVLDGLPLLSPDRGDVKWSLLPTESVGQIEVLKGASSVLYGSSAMNGTISLQTQKPTSTPVTRITSFMSFITKPKREITKYWDFPKPSVGFSFMRAHKPTNNFEYNVGGSFYLNNQVYDNGLEYLARVNYRLKWTSKKNPKLSWGFAGNFMYNREYEFFYWQDDTSGAYKAAADNKFENIRLTVDPYVTFYDKKNNRHEIKTRTYFNRPSFNTKTILSNINYQFIKNYAQKELTIITGLDEQFLWINVPAFVNGGKKKANILAGFLQLEKKYKRLTLVGGVRFEYFAYQKLSGVTGAEFRDKNGKLKFYLPGQWRAGLNYQAAKNTYLRFNIGQAYRFPSFAERFVNEQVGDIGGQRALAILPNTSLVPEYGWTSEIGFKQIIKSKRSNLYNGVVDFAFFWQEYKNIVETETVFNDTTVNALIKLRFNNITRARIAGWDISFKNELNYGKHRASFNIGYTYALPAALNTGSIYGLDNVGTFLKYLFKYSYQRVGSDTAEQLLKYRNRHLLTLDMDYTYNNFFNIGFDARFYSKMENFDKIFIAIPGVSDYLANSANVRGYFVMNTRMFFTVKKKHNLGLIVNNILNTEYWLRVGRLEPPRSVTLQYRIEF
ncbi:MAG: TonB-dependent receptor [Chitinophagales bacterium]